MIPLILRLDDSRVAGAYRERSVEGGPVALRTNDLVIVPRPPW